MKRRDFDKLTHTESKDVTLAALTVADLLFVTDDENFRSVRRFQQACVRLRDLRDVLDARLDTEQT